MLQLLSRIVQEKPFQYVRTGKEKIHGIVLGVEHGRWMLDSNSNILMIQDEAIFVKIIEKTIEYLAQISDHPETLIFEDNDGQIVKQFGKQLIKSGYHIRKMNFTDSLKTELWYMEVLRTPTAIVVSTRYWSEFMRNLIIYTIETCADNVLPSPMTIILSHETASDGTLSISRAVHRNIFFVVKGNTTNECKNGFSLYADTVIKCSQRNKRAVILKQGFQPIAKNFDF